MNTTTPKISPLRQRMIEDMRIRKLEPKTQSGYIRAVRDNLSTKLSICPILLRRRSFSTAAQ
jgi:hypothetical protein